LVAAILSTIGSCLGVAVPLMSSSQFVIYIAGAGAGLGTVGGLFWVWAAWRDRRNIRRPTVAASLDTAPTSRPRSVH
jgi:hypothetical protein